MRSPIRNHHREGAILPLTAICLVGMMGFVALAIDVGVMFMARSQSQNAADSAALAGARTLDGRSTNNNNSVAARDTAKATAKQNRILNEDIIDDQITTCQVGIYRYDNGAGRFQAVFGQSPGTNESYGAVQVKLASSSPTYFGKMMGVNSLNVSSSATAVHRPRDIAIVLDFSGSMGYSSRFNYSYNQVQSLNPDPDFPRFGPWSIYAGSGMVLDPNSPGSQPSNLRTYTPPTPMQRVWAYQDGTGYLYAPNNMTMETASGSPLVGNFLLADRTTNAFVRSGSFPSFTNVNVSGATFPTTIVTPAPSSFVDQNVTGFVGDPFPLRSGVTVSVGTPPTPSQYAQTVADYLGISRGSVTNTTRNTTFERNGYDWDFSAGALKAASKRFQGFTMGPGHYGKTFYMWPPDPRTPAGQFGDAGYVAGDWRLRFFSPRSGSSQDTQDTAMLFDSSGRWREQETGTSAAYLVNYDNILSWLKRGPQTLPASLSSGRIVYYSAIPSTIPIDATRGRCTTSATEDQRFWKDYIDFVLGAGRWADYDVLYGVNSSNANTGGGSTRYYNNPSTSNLAPQITSRSTLLSSASSNSISGATKANPIVVTDNGHGLTTGDRVTLSSVGGNTAANGTWYVTVVDSNRFSLNGSSGNANYTSGGSWKVVPYVHYTDSPVHPRMQFWFGPLSMLAYLQAPGNWLPGTSYEAQCWQLKAGINAALSDIRNNHPNDLASVVFYSGSNGYNTARVPMSKRYDDMQNSLYFPYSILGSLSNTATTIRPYTTTTPSNSNPAGLSNDADTEIPNAGSSTCPEMGFMVAYNEFSGATNASTSVTYTGRQTASKVVIFESDGIPNTVCSGTLSGSATAGKNYYAGIGGATSATTTSALDTSAKNDARAIVRQLCALNTASPPGHSTTRNLARVHALSFGDLFESYSSSPMKAGALRFMCAVQIDGNTSPKPLGTWDNDSLDYNAYYLNIEPYKLITGDSATRIDKISQAMRRIMQGGVQISLIE